MNGDSETIYKAIQDLSLKVENIRTKQLENHEMNKDDIESLFQKIDIINNRLKCDLNEQKIINMNGHLKTIYTIIISVILGGIVLGVWVRTIIGG